MTTTERRDELATIRLLGGTARHATRIGDTRDDPDRRRWAQRPKAIVAVAVAGAPRGLTGFRLIVPLALTGGLAAGAAVLVAPAPQWTAARRWCLHVSARMGERSVARHLVARHRSL
jgi:hypothetical protein